MTTLTKRQVLAICHAAGWRDGEMVTAARVAWRETRGRPDQQGYAPVYGGCTGPGSRYAQGLFQIVPACHPSFDAERGRTDPLYNAVFAHQLWSHAGWAPWKQDGKVPPDGLDATAGPVSEWMEALTDTGSPGAWIGDVPGDVWGAATAPLRTIDDLADLLTSPDTWRRVLLVVVGGVLVVLGVAAISSDLGDPLAAVRKLAPVPKL